MPVRTARQSATARPVGAKRNGSGPPCTAWHSACASVGHCRAPAANAGRNGGRYHRGQGRAAARAPARFLSSNPSSNPGQWAGLQRAAGHLATQPPKWFGRHRHTHAHTQQEVPLFLGAALSPSSLSPDAEARMTGWAGSEPCSRPQLMVGAPVSHVWRHLPVHPVPRRLGPHECTW